MLICWDPGPFNKLHIPSLDIRAVGSAYVKRKNAACQHAVYGLQARIYSIHVMREK